MKKEKNIIDIGELFSQAWQIYKENWSNFLLIGLIFLVVNGIGNSSGFHYDPTTKELVGTGFNFLKLIVWLATTYLSIGYIRYLFHLTEGKKAKIEEIFHGVDSLSHFVYVILVSIIVGITILLGTIFLIIPGVIVALGFMFAKYIVIENKGGDIEVFEALKKSWNITKGYKWKLLYLSIILAFFNFINLVVLLLGIMMVSPFLIILGIIVLFIGLIITVPISSIIMVSAYKKLSSKNNIISVSEKKEE